jgi:hypothetical protein
MYPLAKPIGRPGQLKQAICHTLIKAASSGLLACRLRQPGLPILPAGTDKN